MILKIRPQSSPSGHSNRRMFVLTRKNLLVLVWAAELLLICTMIFTAFQLFAGLRNGFTFALFGAAPYLLLWCLELIPYKPGPWNIVVAFHQGGALLWGSIMMIFLVVSLIPRHGRHRRNAAFPAVLFDIGDTSTLRRISAHQLKMEGNSGKKMLLVRIFAVGYSAFLFLVLKAG